MPTGIDQFARCASADHGVYFGHPPAQGVWALITEKRIILS